VNAMAQNHGRLCKPRYRGSAVGISTIVKGKSDTFQAVVTWREYEARTVGRKIATGHRDLRIATPGREISAEGLIEVPKSPNPQTSSSNLNHITYLS